MRKLVQIMMTVSMLAGVTAVAETLTVNPKRLVKVIGRVDGDIISEAAKLRELSLESNAPIYVLVNSPGGYVSPGLLFVDSIKEAQSRGVKIHCVSGVMAASMGFVILSHCDKVYSMPSAMLMFHPMRVGGEFTAADLGYQYARMKELELPLYSKQREAFGLPVSFFRLHYARETLWTASVLARHTKQIHIVDRIDGIGKDALTYARRLSLFGSNSTDELRDINGTIYSIAPGFDLETGVKYSEEE